MITYLVTGCAGFIGTTFVHYMLKKYTGIQIIKVGQNAYNRYSSTEMYVAMTRAMKAIYFITDQDSVVLSVPQGI